LNLVSGYLRPTNGDVLLEGRRVTGLPPYRLCHLGVGRTFQIVKPFNEMTVLDNIAAGALFSGRGARSVAAARASVPELAELVGLQDVLHVPAARLSIGEKKKLELARALATRPHLLLIDEVMGGLPLADVQDMIGVLRRVHAAGATLLMIEHVLHAVTTLAEHVVVLEFGRKIAEGAPRAVLADPVVVASYLGAPADAPMAEELIP
jgi:branched-chain amino acid transport system ATP-binding protein